MTSPASSAPTPEAHLDGSPVSAATTVRARRVRVPVVLQVDESESGAACLGMVLAHYDRVVPLSALAEACEASRDGAKAELIAKAAKTYGMGVDRHERALGRLVESDALPQILAWRSSHWVVLEGYDARSVRIIDPEVGPSTVRWGEAERLYGGITLVLEPGPGSATGSDDTPLLRDLRSRLGPARAGIALGIVAGLFLLVPGLALPLVVTQLATAVLQPKSGGNPVPLLAALLLSCGLIGVLTLLQGWFLSRVQARLTASGSFRVVDHLLRLPVGYFSQRPDGMAVARLDQVYFVYWLLSGPLVSAGVAAVGLIAYGVVMVAFSPLLAGVMIGAMVLNVVVLILVFRRRRELNLVQLRQGTRLAGLSTGVLSNLEAVKASGGDDAAFERWAGHQASYLLAGQKVGQSNNAWATVPVLLATLTSVTLIVLGAMSVMAGTLSLGVLVGFQALATSFLAPVSQIATLMRQSQTARARLAEVNDVLQSPPDPGFTPAAAGGVTTPLRGALEVRGVEFGYAHTDQPVVTGVDLTLSPGSRVALVGGSGSGKSTLVKLILGLHEPWSGEILFDGHPRREWDRRHLTRAVSFVDQRIMLFQGTVRDNLTLWDHAIPTDQLIAAARDACIHDDIVSRAGGYDTEVQEGGRNFSGGQRQRLEIARASSSTPPSSCSTRQRAPSTPRPRSSSTATCDAEERRASSSRTGSARSATATRSSSSRGDGWSSGGPTTSSCWRADATRSW